MDCNTIIDYYDEFRDQDLDPSVEKVVIEHLENCTTCNMDYDMRDSALGDLQDFSADFPPMSEFAEQKIAMISKKRSALPYKLLSAALAAACLFLILYRPNIPTNKPTAPVFSDANFTQRFTDLENKLRVSETNNNKLINQVATLIKSNQHIMVNKIDQKLNSRDYKGEEVVKLLSAIDDDLKGVKVILQEGGGQATLFVGQGWEDDKKNELISTPDRQETTGIAQRVREFKNTVEGLN